MKKIFFTLFLAVITTAVLQAQQISVVTPGGDTSIFRTLPEAIKDAAPGSVIYLPGGGFSIPDSVKITKKLTIIGIGHKSNNDNVDGVTTISGNLYFNEGSSGSAVLGCYITGFIRIGDDKITTNDILIKYCNVSNVSAFYKCSGIVVNQNYIRSYVSTYDSSSSTSYSGPIEITNNVISRIISIDGGVISNNIITFQRDGSSSTYPLTDIKNTIITNNVILNNYSAGTSAGTSFVRCSNSCSISGNMFFRNETVDNDSIDMKGIDPNTIFENYNNGKVDPASNFHFKEDYKQYENQVGVYAGGVEFDQQLAPVPFIVAKHVNEQTDAQGKLNVKIRVKAGQ